MAIVETIIPIFLIIIFGYLIKTRDFFQEQFFTEANRLIFFVSLPLLIFTGIVKSSIQDIALLNILSVILPTVVILCISLMLGIVLGLRRGKLGSFVQTTFHGNVSYIGLAVLFYMLGEEGLIKGSLLIGFLILVNNTLSIAVLSWTSQRQRNIVRALLLIFKTPVVIATFLGMVILYLNIPIPRVLMKSMGILANIALPLALLLIGASISIENIKKSFRLSITVSLLKLMALPCLSVLFCRLYSISPGESFAGIILLATPVATTSYILACEMGGDADLASNAVTLSTLFSPVAFIFWTFILGIN